MSSFSEFHSTTTDYRSNGHVRGDRQGQQQQHRTGKRQLRRSFERQLSDKHLKRRTQLLQQQNNKGKHGTVNRRFLYEDPLATVVSGSSSTSSLPQLDHHHPSQSSYDWHRRRRCPDPSGLFSNRHKNRSIFLVFLLMVLFLLILLLVLPTLLSPSATAFSPKTIQSMSIPGIIQGGGNGAALDNGSGNVNSGNGNEKGRSYQDLADSIRQLRIRRQAMDEGKPAAAAAAENDQLDANVHVDNDVDVDYDSDRRIPIGRRRGRLDDDQEEENRLKRLEERIQMDQKEKVRQEILLSKDNHNSNNDGDVSQTNGQRRIPNGTAGRRSDPQETNGNQDPPEAVDDPSALKNKVMSENIAALKLFNEKNQKSH